MWAVHQRMAELWTIQQRQGLSPEQITEMAHCLKVNVQRAWRIAFLMECSYLAHTTNDVEWQFEICAELEKLGETTPR
ncbi:DUF7667 family protein [Desmospora activa]|uniref:Uncharacterized protein n=1 Tax=Desmospora activa DSM 45169 TaxID=1121389 RepID=A0A2T4Z8W7_9BACL|nr:hypothetical protein [Desmospora activa]PTM58344.1 hypothetical protein C8J48_0926 [Desmospora activa DSM 45169]